VDLEGLALAVVVLVAQVVDEIGQVLGRVVDDPELAVAPVNASTKTQAWLPSNRRATDLRSGPQAWPPGVPERCLG